MGHRLSKIYTRTGDKGTTGLANGKRIAKNSSVCIAMGDIDELNSQMGVLLSQSIPDRICKFITQVQHTLFDIGAECCMDNYIAILEAQVNAIENEIDYHNESLAPLKEFILPKGNYPTTLAHLCRSVCRRAERSLMTLHDSTPVNPASLAYINRLSDYFFVIARTLDSSNEIMWQHSRDPE